VVGGGKTVVVWMEAGARVARFWADGAWASEQFTLAADGMWGQTVWDGTQFAAVWQDPDYHSHWATFDLDGNVSPAEALFPDEECVGPKLASNGAGQALLNCVRYNRDYSRRLVNYLLGDPLPDESPPSAEPEPEPTVQPEPASEPTPVEPEPGASSGDDDLPVTGGSNDAGPSGASGQEPETSAPTNNAAESSAEDSPIAEDAGVADEDVPQGLVSVPLPKSDQSGLCQVGVRLGASARGSSWGWFALGLLGLVAHRRIVRPARN
jgi:MYXO-CTERM domain-containing protein